MSALTKIIFSKSAIPFILSIFGHSIDDEHFIYNDELKCRALTPEGEEIKADQLGAIEKGPNDSILFIKSDLHSIMKLADRRKKSDE